MPEDDATMEAEVKRLEEENKPIAKEVMNFLIGHVQYAVHAAGTPPAFAKGVIVPADPALPKVIAAVSLLLNPTFFDALPEDKRRVDSIALEKIQDTDTKSKKVDTKESLQNALEGLNSTPLARRAALAAANALYGGMRHVSPVFATTLLSEKGITPTGLRRAGLYFVAQNLWKGVKPMVEAVALIKKHFSEGKLKIPESIVIKP